MTITSLSPSTAVTNSPTFTLTVNGSGFLPNSIVQWNGEALSTGSVSASELTAVVTASLVASPGTATIGVSNSGITSNSVAFQITAAITLGCPANSGTTGVLYNSSLTGAGGVPPYVYSIASGALPPGLTLNSSSGATSGSPTAAGTSTFTAKVVDSSSAAGGPDTTTAVCSIAVVSGPVLTSLSPSTTTAGSPTFTMTVYGSGFGPNSEVLWNGGALPTTFGSAGMLTAVVGSNLIAAQGNATVAVDSNSALSNLLMFAILAVAPQVTVTLTPAGPITLYSGGQRRFAVTVAGVQTYDVSYSLNPAGADSGTINNLSNIYRAPSYITAAKTVTLTATVTSKDGKITYGSASAVINLDPTVITQVEFTQAIQQLQTLADLATSVNNTGQAPVPMVAAKTAALRIYTVPGGSVFTVKANVAGKELTPIDLTLQADPKGSWTDVAGSVARQRTQTGTPRFLFSPPAGDWTATLNVYFGKGNNATLIQGPITFNFKKSPAQNMLVVYLKIVCDAQGAAGCPKGSDVGTIAQRAALINYLGDLLPTQAVEPRVLPGEIRVLRGNYAAGKAGDVKWFQDVLKELAKERDTLDALNSPPAPGALLCVLGVARASVSNTVIGQAGGLGNRVALALVSATTFNLDSTAELWAHELGHALGLRHTNTAAPAPPNPQVKPPYGCTGLAWDPGTDWPFTDNYIQTVAPVGAPAGTPPAQQIGFIPRVPTVVGVSAPLNVLDIMGYCYPQWIAPIHYNKALTCLTQGAPAAACQPAPPNAGGGGAAPGAAAAANPANQVYWEVSGDIDGNVATLDPLFGTFINYPGTASSTGSYQLRLLDASGHTLYNQTFDPVTAIVCDPTDETLSGSSYFYTTVPVLPNAAVLVVLDSGLQQIGEIVLGGSPPKITITYPTPNATVSGVQTITWNISGSGSTFFSKVEYSPDNGTTWIGLGDTSDTSSQVDFGALPGSQGASAWVRVWSSDGAHVGLAVSSHFVVPNNVPSDPVIDSPDDESSFGPDATVEFIGGALAGDGATLAGGNVQWSSNLDGVLGRGATLYHGLSAGRHIIAMTATDGQGRDVSKQVDVNVASGPPSLTIQTSTLANGCPAATIQVTADRFVALASISYTVDGGATFQSVTPAQLPFSFPVPGQGEADIMASATDAAGQITAAIVSVTLPASCGN